jgi:hypothetical protein
MGALGFESSNPMSNVASLLGRQESLEWATFALRRLSLANAFSGFDQKSVELVKNSLIVRQMLMQELLRGGVAVARGDQAMTCQDAARIGVRDEEGLLSGVEQDGIDGLRSKASQFEQLAADRLRGLGKERVKRSLVGSVKPSYKRFDGTGLLPKVPGGADASFKLGGGNRAQSRPSEESAFPKATDRRGDIPPTGILSQDGAEDDLQASACRPPTLWAELLQQRFVVLPKHLTRLNSKRLSRALHRLEINTVFTGKSSSDGDFRKFVVFSTLHLKPVPVSTRNGRPVDGTLQRD